MSPCAAENLTVLELDNCPLVTDTSLDHLTSCHNLQRVELYDCQLITRVGIRRLRVSIFIKQIAVQTKAALVFFGLTFSFIHLKQTVLKSRKSKRGLKQTVNDSSKKLDNLLVY